MQAFDPRTAVLALALGTLAASLSAGPAWAQARVPVKVTVTVGGRTETFRGTGECGHEPRGSIYDVEAALWMAAYTEGNRHVALSYWRPLGGGGDQFSLFVQSGPTDHRISTVKGAQPEGSGRSTFQPTSMGGRFEITGKDQTGSTLSAIIECARFGAISAEGG
ncbi:MAG TPA: hypothetical protein VFI16_10520 [Anaeromyxobacteraceae bacterium]|nr:hypothetical protein [Anaeromyxobacteraceae bacterium]